jgi:hypothetical protein
MLCASPHPRFLAPRRPRRVEHSAYIGVLNGLITAIVCVKERLVDGRKVGMVRSGGGGLRGGTVEVEKFM